MQYPIQNSQARRHVNRYRYHDLHDGIYIYIYIYISSKCRYASHGAFLKGKNPNADNYGLNHISTHFNEIVIAFVCSSAIKDPITLFAYVGSAIFIVEIILVITKRYHIHVSHTDMFHYHTMLSISLYFPCSKVQARHITLNVSF